MDLACPSSTGTCVQTYIHSFFWSLLSFIYFYSLLILPLFTYWVLYMFGNTRHSHHTQWYSYLTLHMILSHRHCYYYFSCLFLRSIFIQTEDWTSHNAVRTCVLLDAHRTLHYTTLHYTTVLYSTLHYYTVLYCTRLYCTRLYCTVLYCTVLYCIVLYCTEHVL